MSVRILMFGWEFPPHNSGGLGTACLGLTRALTKSGAEIIFVLPKRVPVDYSFLRFAFADLQNIHFTPVDSFLYPYITGTSYRVNRPSSDIYGPTLYDEVRRYADRARELALTVGEYNVIHAHDWLAFLAGIAAKEVSGKPLVVHVHATEFDRTGSGQINQAVYDIEKRGLDMADRVVAVSNFTKNMLVKHYGINPDKVEVVHNGVEEEPIDHHLSSDLLRLKAEGGKIVLFVGRITLQKGPDYFLSAAARVLQYEPNTYFVIAGSGDMERQIIMGAASLGVANRVIFAGFVRGAELQALYRAADLYVLPSVSEPFGITPLESLINGTPVIISKQSGVSEVIKHALKVDFWDVDEMANQIISVLRHPQLKQTLSIHGGREAAGVTWDRAAAKCLAVYRSLVVV